jgi:hypothetical protein
MGWPMPESSNAWWEIEPTHPDAPAMKAFVDAQRKERAERLSPTIPRRKAANQGYITWAQLGDYMEHVGKTMAEELRKRDERIAELEARPVGLNYAGVFKPTASYPKHSAVSHAGSVWCARKDFPPGEPGTVNSGWQLVCKRGRDGKDGKDGQ